jgi:hypothetical protein
MLLVNREIVKLWSFAIDHRNHVDTRRLGDSSYVKFCSSPQDVVADDNIAIVGNLLSFGERELKSSRFVRIVSSNSVVSWIGLACQSPDQSVYQYER